MSIRYPTLIQIEKQSSENVPIARLFISALIMLRNERVINSEDIFPQDLFAEVVKYAKSSRYTY